MSSGRCSTIKATATTHQLFGIRPNTWNYNRQSEYIFSKEVNSIRKYGFLVPLLVRDAPDTPREELRDLADRLDGLRTPTQLSMASKELVDGEHRWKALCTLSNSPPDDLSEETRALLESGEIPVVDLGFCSIQEAQKLSIILNETKGEADPEALSTLLASMEETESLESLAADFPFTEEELSTLLDDMQEPPPVEEPAKKEESGEFVRMKVTMPATAYEVYLEARRRVERELAKESFTLHSDESIAEGQVIEAIVAEFLAGTDG